MNMKSFTLVYTDTAAFQLRDIVQYIAEASGDPQTARNWYNEAKATLSLLADQPYMGRKPRQAIIRAMGYRMLVIGNYLAFYSVSDQEKRVNIEAIVDGRREYLRLLQ